MYVATCMLTLIIAYNYMIWQACLDQEGSAVLWPNQSKPA